ncbi:phosphatidylserine decarboxylase [Coprinopsis sp. MPI-PUGE-AT-0042]|nr:phosphatidylserine decarboxylase [Coprinopsis sp. MPI-PUGE-AT-0042]
MSERSQKLTEAFRRGGWLPANQTLLNKWVKKKVEHSRTLRGAKALLHPVLQELKTMIESDGDMFMGFNRMFENATTQPLFGLPSSGQGSVKGYEDMLALMNQVLTEAPFYGALGPPFYMILYEAMNTQGGFTAFVTDKVNAQFKKVFDTWAEFLNSPESASVLTSDPGGWFSAEALTAMSEDFDGLPFQRIFVSDPDAPYWGFKSWDDFFVRQLRPEVRVVELPDQPNVISAACESRFYNQQSDVKEADQFWIKGEPYSLRHMLNNDETVSQFIGGSIFQGFLQVTGYHRWHAPVDGVIKKIVTVPGTYFAQSPALIGVPSSSNPFLSSLSFITSLTARQLIFIESSNPSIGLMCFIAIGMTEVSTCEATVKVGQTVKRGDELGMFHFGGSSHCLVFRPEAKIQWDSSTIVDGELVKVRAAIGAVTA